MRRLNRLLCERNISPSDGVQIELGISLRLHDVSFYGVVQGILVTDAGIEPATVDLESTALPLS